VIAARAALRAATAEDHARLDGLFERFDLGDRDGYGRFLAAHAAAVPPIEQALDTAGMARLLPDWTSRRRSAAVRADLAALGLAVPPPLAAPLLADDAACWGTAYVIEGSRLGGALLARSVGNGLPRAYLAAPQPKGAWRDFLTRLEVALDSEGRLADATAAARATFAIFEAAGRLEMERIDG